MFVSRVVLLFGEARVFGCTAWMKQRLIHRVRTLRLSEINSDIKGLICWKRRRIINHDRDLGSFLITGNIPLMK